MREIIETKEIKEVINKETKISCDLCGIKAKKESWNDGGVFDINETEVEVVVKQKEGTIYPEGGSGFKIVVDICPSCFKNKLVPWLRSQGANIDEVPWDC